MTAGTVRRRVSELERWQQAKSEVGGAVVICVLVVAVQVALAPDGWLWDLLRGGATAALVAAVAYAVLVRVRGRGT